MLDNTTKKRIDDCRDILVGKLPDPKSQIEQITIALIYKFMDDMDKEAIDLGGQAKFFTGDYANYSWDALFNAKVTAAEMLKLYSAAIESMEKNPNIPQLFRDIFKNAYLPYRDPETLKLFLKTIGEFTYTHSEKLGDAFEYLLSVMGSQGDAGQFRTPRHIIDFLVAAVDPQKTDTILDPACGTAGFLISAFKHIRQGNENKLTPDERKKLINNFIGYDISPDMVRLSLVNLYLHGFSDPHIFEYDTLTSEQRWDDTYDVILANPPFMSPKGGIRPHKKFTVASNRSEVLFVDYIAEHLNPKGRAGIIVPEGVIFQSGKAYKELRKMLVENYLYAVVSLPAGVFNPYSGVKTSILLMDRELAKKSGDILFIKIDNDGYNLGAQRTAVKGGQLTDAIDVIQQFRTHLTGPVPVSPSTITTDIAHTVPKTKIAAHGDYNLSGERYKTIHLENSEYEFISLSDEEVFKVVSGGTPSSNIEEYWNGNINWATLKDLPANESISTIDSTVRKITEEGLRKSSAKQLPVNSILVSTRATIGRIAINKVECSTNQGFKNIIINDFSRANTNFVALMMTKLIDKMNLMATGGTFKELSTTSFKKLQIPLPPVAIQEEIVAEIEGYQKIIDGAKMVVDNYKPQITIDPDWEMVELGEVADITSSKRIYKEEYVSSGIPFYRTKEIVELSKGLLPSMELFISNDRYQEIKEKYDIPREGDILISAVGTLGVSWVVNHTNPFYFKDGNLVWFKDFKNVDANYLKLILDVFVPQQIHILSAGAAYKALTIVKLKQLKIPLPDSDTQRQIVAQIEKEQEMVNASKQLIAVFEQKIEDRIARVWGISTPLDAGTSASPSTGVKKEENKEQTLPMAAEGEVVYGKEV